ncbi:interactor of constitutive active ROPs 1-like [Raphanus sativus]|uniref:Interactor of constitutive active ROPs 1-like n=1 Tax=Raphanus sativus TaxID=3726 RepID=A0A6J0K5Q3_RAPSA|nr:interactor of constitutive active ROPs 1-like [Raphanus sativus]
MSKVKANEDEMASNVCRIGEELEESREEKAQIKEKLEFMGEAKEALEAEMKTLGVQTEQWRKAADVAAAVSRQVFVGGGLFDQSEVVGFMDDDDTEDELGSGNRKRKSSWMKMFGDLWKKKGHK